MSLGFFLLGIMSELSLLSKKSFLIRSLSSVWQSRFFYVLKMTELSFEAKLSNLIKGWWNLLKVSIGSKYFTWLEGICVDGRGISV